MKKVALISSFCDTDEKIDVLIKNIHNVKNFDVDVFLLSPIHLPERVTSLCDYYFQTKDNPVLKWPFKAMTLWKLCQIDGLSYRMDRTFMDYGWAGLFQVKQLSQIALLLGYDQFFHMIYDLKFDETVIDGFKSERTKTIYSSKRGPEIWKAGLHFMIFDRKNLERFVSLINLDSYIYSCRDDAFSWLSNLHSVFPYDSENNPVEDEIYYYGDADPFNYSPIEGIPFFVIKNDQSLENIKLLLHSPSDSDRIKVMVENLEIGEIPPNGIIDLGFNKDSLPNVSIIFEGCPYDITSIIGGIGHNTLSAI